MQNLTPQNEHLDTLIIVGGGTAGWMAAASLSKVITAKNVQIILVESEQIGTVGVGEATIPQIAVFNKILGIDEDEFVKATNATFKLGIEFVNWGNVGDSYIHPFGSYGTELNNLHFFYFWQKLYQQGKAPDISDYSIHVKACHHNKFMRPQNIQNSPLSNIPYAFHFDATLYAKYLRQYAEDRGVKRVEAIVEHVNQNKETGHIESITLNNGEILSGDFFIDCTGFRGLLIEKTLHTGYEDWSHHLPCDSAIAVATEKQAVLSPYTRATAHSAGWQWRIPLQHRTGNGHVFCSKFISQEDAEKTLMDHLDTPQIGDPKLIRFTTGRRRKHWNKNCVALGLASGFLEPLESTSIHLIQEGISKFINLFPSKNFNPILSKKYNQQMDNAFEFVRDFLVLHYKVTQRNDSAFWDYCRTMEVPDTLLQKIDLYQSSSVIFRDNEEFFNEISWLAVMHGQGIRANGYNSVIDSVPQHDLEKRLHGIAATINKCVDAMPTHQEFIDQHCKSNKV